MGKGIVIGIMLTVSIVAHSNPQKTPVYLQPASDDLLGERIVYSLKQDFIKSEIFDLVEAQSQGYLQIFLTTMKVKDENFIAYSIVWTVAAKAGPIPLYYASNVGICGKNRLDECAVDLIASTDNVASQLRASVQK